MKRFFVDTNADKMVVYTDGSKCVVINETAFDEPLTLDYAKTADFSNFVFEDDIEVLAANYNGELYEYDEIFTADVSVIEF